MTYSIDELYDAFYRQYQIKADGGGYAYIEQYIKESEGINSVRHKFILSGGHDPIIISCWEKEELYKSAAEDQPMKPGDIIKEKKKELWNVINSAAETFVSETGIPVEKIEIEFHVSKIAGKERSLLSYIKIHLKM